MNLHHHRVIFNKSRSCMMAVSEVASSAGSGKTSKSARSRKSPVKRCPHADSSLSSLPKLNSSHFYLENTPLAQSIRSRAAIYSIVSHGACTLPRSNLNSNFASVNEQSGFRAGDAGFAVNVTGNTALVGGVITSTQTAVDNHANSFRTGGALNITDVQNTASFTGQGGSIGISVGVGQDKDKNSTLTPGGSAGFGTVKGDAASVATGGISGIAGNAAVRTGDANTGLTRIFDPAKEQRELDARVAITGAFTQQLGPIVGRAVISLLDRMTTPDQSPTAARPTPAADKVVRSDQDMRAGFAAIANSTELKDPEKAFFADVAKAYSSNTHFAGLVGLATTDPVGYQQSVTPQTDSQVDSPVDRGAMSPVVLPLVSGAAGASPAAATSAANAWAASVRDSGLVYDPQTDTLRSASGGVISGERFWEVIGNGLSGTASGVKEVFRLAFPFAAAVIQTVTGLVPNGTTTTNRPEPLSPNNTGNNSPVTVAGGTPSSSSPAPVGANNIGGN